MARPTPDVASRAKTATSARVAFATAVTASPSQNSPGNGFSSSPTSQGTSPLAVGSYPKILANSPLRSPSSLGLSGSLGEAELFKRSVRHMLNKLTCDNFDKLSAELLLNFKDITQFEFIETTAFLIFEKATSEKPIFCPMYAKLCQLLAKNSPPITVEGKLHEFDFKRALVDRCELNFQTKRKPHDLTGVTDKDKREELEIINIKIKQQDIGLINFIGALFVKNMLTESVIHKCLLQLLSDDSSEEDLEHFCTLMDQIGKHLDGDITAYFEKLNAYLVSSKLSSRMKFTIQNLLDLRANNWVPRRETEGPKTIQEVHRAANQKKLKSEMVMQSLINNVSSDKKNVYN